MSKIRVALHGCGNIMRKHARQSEAIAEMEIVGLCDPVEANMDRVIKDALGYLKAPPPKFDDPAKMYEQARPDAVVIASPHTMHYDHACAALDAGCHILMEKPMVTDLGHAIDLEKRVAAAGKVFCIAYNSPCSANIFHLREMVRTGELGRLKAVSLFLSQPWYYNTRGMWRQDPALSGGGQMYDSGAHAINSLCWVIESDVEEVFAYVDKLDTPVDINGVASIKFANGVIAAITITGQGPMDSDSDWMFEFGKVNIDPWHGGRIKIQAGSREEPGGKLIENPTIAGTDGQPLSNWINAILGKEEPRTSPRNGVIQSQLMDAIYRSAETGLPAKPQVYLARR